VHRRFRLSQQAQHGRHHQVDCSLMDWAKEPVSSITCFRVVHCQGLGSRLPPIEGEGPRPREGVEGRNQERAKSRERTEVLRSQDQISAEAAGNTENRECANALSKIRDVAERFLFDVHRRFKLDELFQLNRHYQVDHSLMDWAEVNLEFSDMFQYRLLPVETFPRPITEHERIQQKR